MSTRIKRENVEGENKESPARSTPPTVSKVNNCKSAWRIYLERLETWLIKKRRDPELEPTMQDEVKMRAHSGCREAITFFTISSALENISTHLQELDMFENIRREMRAKQESPNEFSMMGDYYPFIQPQVLCAGSVLAFTAMPRTNKPLLCNR